MAANVAPTFWAEDTWIVQLVALPEQASAQPTNVLPDAGAAVKVTVVPLANDAVHVPAPEQLMPAGLELTAPAPPIVTCKSSDRRARHRSSPPALRSRTKFAPTFSVALTVIWQLSAVPEQAPVQPTKISPGDGVAVSTTVLLLGKDWMQPLDPLQSMPAGLEVTLPAPPTVTNTVSAAEEADDAEALWPAAAVADEFVSKSPPLPPPQPATTVPSTQSTARRAIRFILRIRAEVNLHPPTCVRAKYLLALHKGRRSADLTHLKGRRT